MSNVTRMMPPTPKQSARRFGSRRPPSVLTRGNFRPSKPSPLGSEKVRRADGNLPKGLVRHAQRYEEDGDDYSNRLPDRRSSARSRRNSEPRQRGPRGTPYTPSRGKPPPLTTGPS